MKISEAVNHFFELSPDALEKMKNLGGLSFFYPK